MNWNNTYVQVDSGVAEKIRKMKEEQEAIPHYKAKVQEVGDLSKQSKCEIMIRLKHNIDEIKKQYKNEDSKGWISSCGYTRFSYEEKYVFPVLDYLFDINGLADMVNEFNKKQALRYWEFKHGDKEEYYNGDYCVRKIHMPIHNHISFIRDIRQSLIFTIEGAEELRDIEMKVSFNTSKMYLDNEANINKFYSVNFYLANEDKKRITICENNHANGDILKTDSEVKNFLEENKISENFVKLSEWKNNLTELIKQIEN